MKAKKFKASKKQIIWSSIGIVLVIAIVVSTILIMENNVRTNIVNNYSQVFASPFKQSDDNSGKSRLDVDGITTYFQPYRNQITKFPEHINDKFLTSKGWAVWGENVTMLEYGAKYRMTVTMAVDTVPQDPYTEIAAINTHQTGLADGHHICETPNDNTRIVIAADFTNKNEFVDISMDMVYREFKADEMHHLHNEKDLTEYDGVYNKGELELRIGWVNESIGLKIKEIKFERLNQEMSELKVTSVESLPINISYPIKTDIAPYTASRADIIWESSNEEIASVENGIILTKSKGQTTIKAKTTAGQEESFDLEVTIPTNQITLNIKERTVAQNDSFLLESVIEPSNSDFDIIWSSSDEQIAKVENGKVTGIAPGMAIITVSSGNHNNNCSVYVSEHFKDIVSGADVDPSEYEAIINVCAKGIMSKTANETFEPRKNILKKDFLYSTAKLLGYENFADNSINWPYKDAVEDMYKQAILFLYKQDIFKGTKISGDLYLNGNEEITRQEALFILGNTIDRNPDNQNVVLMGEDISSIADWAVDSIKNILSNNIDVSVKENGKSYYKPTDILTRREAAVLLSKLELNIVSSDEIPVIKAYLDKEIKLPENVNVKLSNGAEKTLKINWNTDEIKDIKSLGIFTVHGEALFRNKRIDVSTHLTIEQFINDDKYFETIYAGEYPSKDGAWVEDDSKVRVLPVGEFGDGIMGDHGVWGIEYSLEPGKYLINFVIQIDKSTANDFALQGDKIAAINPFFNTTEDVILRNISLDNFSESNMWYNINAEFNVTEKCTVEMRLWYGNNVTMKVREVEVYGISKVLSEEVE